MVVSFEEIDVFGLAFRFPPLLLGDLKPSFLRGFFVGINSGKPVSLFIHSRTLSARLAQRLIPEFANPIGRHLIENFQPLQRDWTISKSRKKLTRLATVVLVISSWGECLWILTLFSH
jgi:hypothetical protein